MAKPVLVSQSLCTTLTALDRFTVLLARHLVDVSCFSVSKAIWDVAYTLTVCRFGCVKETQARCTGPLHRSLTDRVLLGLVYLQLVTDRIARGYAYCITWFTGDVIITELAWWLLMTWRLFGARASAITMLAYAGLRVSGFSHRYGHDIYYAV